MRVVQNNFSSFEITKLLIWKLLLLFYVFFSVFVPVRYEIFHFYYDPLILFLNLVYQQHVTWLVPQIKNYKWKNVLGVRIFLKLIPTKLIDNSEGLVLINFLEHRCLLTLNAKELLIRVNENQESFFNLSITSYKSPVQKDRLSSCHMRPVYIQGSSFIFI